ncbi:MAG TPA: radical SAM protein [Methylophilaceae bacterium]|nr:radical SAM protein [Methylophilaceae bacterium]
MKKLLTTSDHNRDVSGLEYVYPVVSRRAGGVSIGINLNVNNACNWRCIYCNVPNLTRGSPPPIDLILLAKEFRLFLNDIVHGDFMKLHVKESDQVLKDVAFSGNGEPTSAKEFPEAVALVQQILKEFDLLDKINIRLITNGSMLHRQSVKDGIKKLAEHNGEVWFKLDAATADGIARINDVNINPNSHIEKLKICAQICPTFIQTCMFALDEKLPSEDDIAAYIDLIKQLKGIIEGVHLYGIARQSMQPEAPRLSQLPPKWFNGIASRLEQAGIKTQISP